MWYDKNFNPIDTPHKYEICIHVQKPHTRTLIFGKFTTKTIRFELPQTVFICNNHKFKRLDVGISLETPTLNSQLYDIRLPNVYGDGVCLEHLHDYYDLDETTPQDLVDYFWQSKFNSSSMDYSVQYLKDPKHYFKHIFSNAKQMIHRMERFNALV